jgi:hypothetical protein
MALLFLVADEHEDEYGCHANFLGIALAGSRHIISGP